MIARLATLQLIGADLRRSPVRVRLTRLAPRLLDDDNLQAALKHVRDGVADALGLHDDDPRLHWSYAQQRERRYAVLVDIEAHTTEKGGPDSCD